jgi:hypothetical protein
LHSLVKADRLWGYAEKRRLAGRLSDASHSRFVEVNLDPALPTRKLYNNLLELGVINSSSRGSVAVDVERINDFFVSRPSSSGHLVLVAHSIMNVPGFSCINVDLNEVNDAVLSIKSNAAGFDEILTCLLSGYCFRSFFLR